MELLKEELRDYKEWYDRMLGVENLIFQTKYQEEFGKYPDHILKTIVEYLKWLKVEFLRLTVKKSNELEDLIYRNGLLTATEKFLEVFAKALATKDIGKFEIDNIIGKQLQDIQYQKLEKIKENKNV